jgi:phage head maturation protease
MNLFTQIEKSDSDGDTLVVSGVISSEATDADSEVISADAMRAALPAYMQFANIREQHNANKAIGTVLAAEVGSDNKTRIRARIVDRDAIAKIRHGVLKGFSIGGKVLKRAGNKIVELLLTEISLVDRPANPDSVFSFGKTFDASTNEAIVEAVQSHVQSYHDKANAMLDYLEAKVDEYNADIRKAVDFSGNGDRPGVEQLEQDQISQEAYLKLNPLEKATYREKRAKVNAKKLAEHCRKLLAR